MCAVLGDAELTPEQYRDLWKVKHQMNTEQQQLDVDAILQRLVETPAGERVRMTCGASDLRSVITDALSIVKGQEASDVPRYWFSEWPTVNGFYWLRGWRHYGDLPISIDGDTFWMMFSLARHHREDLNDSEEVQFLGPVTPYSTVTAALAMRSLCVEKVKSHKDCIDDRCTLVSELESLSIQEQKS